MTNVRIEYVGYGAPGVGGAYYVIVEFPEMDYTFRPLQCNGPRMMEVMRKKAQEMVRTIREQRKPETYFSESPHWQKGISFKYDDLDANTGKWVYTWRTDRDGNSLPFHGEVL